MDATTALDSISTLLTSLSETPHSLELHAKHIKLASLPELTEQFEGAAQLLTDYLAATDQVWLPVLQQKIQRLGIPQDFETSEEPLLINLQEISVETLLDILELFRTAANDYLSISILRKEIKLLILLHASYISAPSNPELGPLLSEEPVRSEIAATVSRGIWHPTEGHILWELQVAWELTCLAQKELNSPQWKIIKAHVESLHLERLKQPHSTHEETLQSYSTFVSTYYNSEEYESRLIFASKVRTSPVRDWDRKERHEAGLRVSPSREMYYDYISSERRSKSKYVSLIQALHDRAISHFASRRWEALADGSDAHVVDEVEDALRSFWCSYIDYVRSNGSKLQEMTTIRRAVRSVPGCGAIWAKYVRAIERYEETFEKEMTHVSLESVTDIYAKALSTSLVQNSVEQILPLILAKAGYEKRHVEDTEGFQVLVRTLEDGISMVRNVAKEGDPRLTLEKFLAGVFTDLEPPLVEQALELWLSTAKYYKSSYLAWTRYIELLMGQQDYKGVRTLFRDLAFKNLDWPEALWQLWVEFEHLHGSVQDIEYCLEKVNLLSDKLQKKRIQEAAEVQKAWIDATRFISEPQAAKSPVDETVAERIPTNVENDSQHHGQKRKGDELEAPKLDSKRIKLDEKAALKRDRENATVFVSNLPSGTREDDLVALFKDCGDIREIKITEHASSLVATVEFFQRESVPAALTKDKKRLRDEEIVVYLAWQSTLYVANFSETTDDALIRELFGHYGDIFDVRWPSKKYKSTRRFCYVQYVSPAAASSALSLHGHECEPGLNLIVYISNPERKQERSDITANAREIYVAGLSRSVSQNDLQKLFEQFGSITSIRLMLDEKGNAKGFAFVEFATEESAAAALAANNQELRKRRIAVTLADTRVQPRRREGTSSRRDRRSRTLRLKNLPPGTQEGLLQQTLEKHAKISRLEVFSNKNEAVVELDSVAEAGRLLLKSEPIIFGDREIQLMEEDLPAISRESTKSGSMFVPRGAGRPRSGLGSKKALDTKKSVPSGISSQMPTLSSAAGRDQDDFRRMLNPAT